MAALVSVTVALGTEPVTLELPVTPLRLELVVGLHIEDEATAGEIARHFLGGGTEQLRIDHLRYFLFLAF